MSAHRLDECLQAARIAVEGDHVTIELALTPGVAMADSFISEMDRDRDGILSADEQRAYMSAATGALRLDVDGRALGLTPIDATFPGIDELRAGTGIIQMRMTAPVAQTVGDHHITFENGHHPSGSVYLANALVPASDRIAVSAQRRDANQRRLTIDYSVQPETVETRAMWLIGAAVAAAISAIALRRAGLLQRMRARTVPADSR